MYVHKHPSLPFMYSFCHFLFIAVDSWDVQNLLFGEGEQTAANLIEKSGFFFLPFTITSSNFLFLFLIDERGC